MKKLVGLFLLSIILFGSCCENNASLDLRFKLKYGGVPLVMFEDLEYPTGIPMFFTKFSFFMSDLQIGSQAVNEIYQLDLTASHSDLEKATEGYVLSIGDLDAESITSISFNIGLDPDLNATTPADYRSTHPMSVGSDYWSPWNSYIFSKTEAKMDTTGDGVKAANIALHLGLDEALREVNFSTNLELDEEETKEVVIIIDLKELFEGPYGIYDIRSVPQIHQTNTMAEINELADNMVAAMSIE